MLMRPLCKWGPQEPSRGWEPGTASPGTGEGWCAGGTSKGGITQLENALLHLEQPQTELWSLWLQGVISNAEPQPTPKS